MKVALIGLGLIGKERLNAILKLKSQRYDCLCVGIYDANTELANVLAQQHSLHVFDALDQILDTHPDWVVVSVPHDIAVPISEFFLSHRINVLVEKPLGRSVKEAKSILANQTSTNHVRVGFNYRFYQGIQHAYRDMQEGRFGEVISVNMQLGHGGRPGDETTWKLDPIQCGGGCLLDPGVHLLDLVNCFSSALNTSAKVLASHQWKGFWNTGIDEECHVMLQSGHTIFNMNVSIVRWRSTFKIEIHGTEGYGIISGRNRSYGQQTYVRGKRWGWQPGKSQADSEELIVTTDGEDTFYNEMKNILFPTENTFLSPCTGEEALSAMYLWEQCMEKMFVHPVAIAEVNREFVQ